MSVLTITVCLMGILFFMAGCLQIGLYVGATPMVSLPAYLPGLLLAAWPLAIAVIVFALLDVRLNLPVSTASNNADDEIPESPMRPTSQTPAEPQSGNFSYFAIPRQQEASPSAPTRPTSQPPSTTADNAHSRQQQSIFATPPPFHPAAAAPVQQPQPPTPPASESQQQQEDPGLSFFKL